MGPDSGIVMPHRPGDLRCGSFFLETPRNIRPRAGFGFKKRSIHAFDRTQPGLPLKPGRCETLTHNLQAPDQVRGMFARKCS